ncbi:MAG: hypothetical protein AAFV86_11910 [Pseudomonadota bacterium]
MTPPALPAAAPAALAAIARRLLGARAARPARGDAAPALRPAGRFHLDTVGHSRHQPALAAIAGPKGPEPRPVRLAAELRLDRTSPAFPDAVAVAVAGDGPTLAWLGPADAVTLRRALAHRRCRARALPCRALVTGGWRDRWREGLHGVKLDLAWPPVLAP